VRFSAGLCALVSRPGLFPSGPANEVDSDEESPVIQKSLGTIAAADIQGLVADRTPEGRTIEFKRDLPGTRDSDRKEFLADVSSFVNALGGDLIFGVDEQGGVAVAADGLNVSNIDAEVLRLDEMIRSGISPRIVGCHTQVVPGLAKGPAVVVRIPRGWNGPHAISFQQDFRFYSRSTNGKFRMDATDVRDAVLAAGSIEQRIRSFRSERVARIVADETPVPLTGTKRIAIHLVPFAAFSSRPAVDLLNIAERSELMQPFYADGGWSAPTFNIDGLYTSAGAGNTENYSYLQIDRAGRIEAAESWMIPSIDPARYPDSIPSERFPSELFAAVTRALRLYELLDVPSPYAVMVSILGAKGVVLALDVFRFRSPLRPLDRDALFLPEVIINDRPVDVPAVLHPLLDALWQSLGLKTSTEYDEYGARKPRR
jgi:hypothetical protein